MGSSVRTPTLTALLCLGEHLDKRGEGMYEKPSLTAQPGPSVSWGENVTLQCRSEIWFDTFYLSKDGSPAPPQRIHLQDAAAPCQVTFNMSPVASAQGGTYRCYGSHSSSPFLLSHPSEPLELWVSGEGPQPCPLCVIVVRDLSTGRC
uniref:Ig-like domain-containing protein n=1 Tax=Suricata suricatta TaxID=37032 RepID=A0A673UNV9_SURSU